MQTKYYVFLHVPGPNWLSGKPITEQPLAGHFQYMTQLESERKLVLGGGFLDGSGAMGVLVADSQAEAESIVINDPAVREQAVAHQWPTAATRPSATKCGYPHSRRPCTRIMVGPSGGPPYLCLPQRDHTPSGCLGNPLSAREDHIRSSPVVVGSVSGGLLTCSLADCPVVAARTQIVRRRRTARDTACFRTIGERDRATTPGARRRDPHSRRSP